VKGYHYTSWENWLKIDVDGLRPYDLRKQEILDALKQHGRPMVPLYGIFMWVRAHTGRVLFGDLMFHGVGKGTDRIVEIEITYDPSERVSFAGRTVDVFHSMNTNPRDPDYRYWHDQEPAHILRDPVPRGRLRLLRVFDLTMCDLLAVDGLYA